MLLLVMMSNVKCGICGKGNSDNNKTSCLYQYGRVFGCHFIGFIHGLSDSCSLFSLTLTLRWVHF